MASLCDNCKEIISYYTCDRLNGLSSCSVSKMRYDMIDCFRPFSAVLRQICFRKVEFIYLSFACKNEGEMTEIFQSFCYEGK